MDGSLYSLDDKYNDTIGNVFVTGSQALVRLPLVQHKRDALQGLNTAGFISGYRGSPLGVFDLQLWKAASFLKAQRIQFQPGVNEELAATAVWGTQQVEFFKGARYDGVFGMWYGKGPGVDRSGDAFKHANSAGTSPHGGVLAVAGDDHGCKSSTLAHQSEYAFMDACIPVFHPADLQELLDFGILGWAMSRFCGTWVGLKVTSDLMDSSGVVNADLRRVEIQLPGDFILPPGGLNARWPDAPLDQESRLHEYKLPAALAFIQANTVDRITVRVARPRLGIITTGKAYLDVCQALEDLGINQAGAEEMGLTVLKVGMPWPLEPRGVRQFADGLDELIVVEEKRPVIEDQLKQQLYSVAGTNRLRITGKFDETGAPLLPSTGELSPALVAQVIAKRIRNLGKPGEHPEFDARLEFLSRQEGTLEKFTTGIERAPFFCSGCPHNISTKVPEGSRALAGIGCHTMAAWRDPNTVTITQMGGEGVTWVGQAPFTDTRHVLQNMGDGTYFHSGSVAIRAAVAAGINITYKILFNDAVAMTGGQPMDGMLTPAVITQQIYSEGVRRIAVVSDEPEKYDGSEPFAPGVTVHHRKEMDGLQRELREVPGVTVLIYDQICAAEKRRRRRRGIIPAATKRVFINESVCEGCGDCSTVSRCLSVMPLETEFGRKRRINQSACNSDYSCLEGFCPSFVTIEGGKLKQAEPQSVELQELPPPPPMPTVHDDVYSILITGIGGTGVVTVAALLGAAAYLEKKNLKVLDQAGLSQKFGAVMSHVRIADADHDIQTARIPAGAADLLLGCDLLVAGSKEALSKLDPERSCTVVNTFEEMTSGFITDREFQLPGCGLRDALKALSFAGQNHELDATSLSNKMLGDSIGANLILLGCAWQRGLVPLKETSILRAIELNGVAVELNLRAFALGRQAAVNPQALTNTAGGADAVPAAEPDQDQELDNILASRMAFLRDYQNAAYARRYEKAVRDIERVEKQYIRDSRRPLSLAVAKNYFKLLAYKDEYEVARLYTSTPFLSDLDARYTGDYKIQVHLAPPLFSRIDPDTGRPRKRAFGRWVLSAMRVLAKLRFLRGSWLDPFALSEDRKLERRLIREYEKTLDTVIRQSRPNNFSLAVELASWPDSVRGFGPVKQEAVEKMQKQRAALYKQFSNP